MMADTYCRQLSEDLGMHFSAVYPNGDVKVYYYYYFLFLFLFLSCFFFFFFVCFNFISFFFYFLTSLISFLLRVKLRHLSLEKDTSPTGISIFKKTSPFRFHLIDNILPLKQLPQRNIISYFRLIIIYIYIYSLPTTYNISIPTFLPF